MKNTHSTKSEGLAPSPFVAALRVAILRKVAELRQDRTHGVTIECLRQLVNSPSHMLDGAPLGTNAVYFYGEIFAEEARRLVPEFLLASTYRGTL